jgi:hypothetical protein
MGFALIGAALAAAGIAAIRHALHGGATLGVTGIVAGVGGMALGGYLVWGFGWLKKRPELIAKAQRPSLLNEDEAIAEEKRQP